MNNKFNNEDIIEVIDIDIDIDEVEVVEGNVEYRNVIDENKKNKKKKRVLVSAATCALLVSFGSGFLINDYLLNRDSLSKTQNMSYNVGNKDKNELNQNNNKSEESKEIENNKSEEVNKKSETSDKKETLTTEEIAKLVSPAVVTVTSISRGNMFTQSQQGVGTGFIVDKEGKVITNYHVIDGASQVVLTLHDGRQVNANIVRTSKKDDLALLQITDNIEMPGVVTLSNSETVNAGQDVVAIGNPLGEELSGTVTKGIVSSPKRMVSMDGYDKEFIQIDAAINPGNSGGPLINTKGEIIGVNTAKTSGENVEGIGFAVPIKYVRQLLENPESYENENSTGENIQSQNGFNDGYYGNYEGGQYPWGGYSNQYPESYSGNQESNGVRLGVKVVESGSGLLVAEVERGSIAEVSGVKANDIIVGVNGVRIKSTSDLKEKLNLLNNEPIIELNVQRNGKTISLVLEV